jgi:predicted O-linked N-acetylglucosamine transferase (SPINDLY family)
MASHAQQARELIAQNKLDAAKALLLRAARASPKDPDICSLLRLVHGRAGQHTQAVYYARRALDLAPGHPSFVAALGDALCIAGEHAEGLSLLRAAAERAPADPMIQTSLARGLFGARDYDGGIEACREAIERGTTDPELPRLLAFALAGIGRAGEGLAVLEEAERRSPGHAPRLSAMAVLANYDERLSAAEIAALHHRQGRHIESSLPPLPGPAPRAEGPERRLRVGIVSADLRDNSVAIFLEPLLEHLDRDSFELVAYNAHEQSDGVTTRLRTHFALWRDIATLPPHQLAAAARSDRIDIALDLGGPADPPRLAAFALRLAPVQANYLGYPNSSGLGAMDARIVDSLTDPSGSEPLASERLLRLDPCFLCYRPPAPAPPVALRSSEGPVVFGSFNVSLKIGPSVLDAWAGVLAALPGSRLILKNPNATLAPVRRAVDGALAARGVPPDRVDLRDTSPTGAEHRRTFAEVDIVLDPFPYNGTTNTCESLFMGVPVVALCGDRHASRVGLSLLTAVGLPDLVAPDPQRYIACAASLAQDRPRLAGLRQSLRGRLLASPLCDERGHAARFGAALRSLWRTACNP